MNWNIEIEKEQVIVSLVVEHIRNTRDEKATYTAEDARIYLTQNNIKANKIVRDCVVHNYQTQQRCSGTWIFSLPSKPKKPPKIVEKKESVSKITNKKTTKK